MALVKYNNNSISAVTAAASIPSGAMNLITTNTITSGVSSSSFTSGINSTYDTYIFKFKNIHPATSNIDFLFNMSIDTGSNYNVAKTTTYFRAAHSEGDQTPDFGYVTGRDLAQGTGGQILASTINNDADSGVSGSLHLFKPSSSTFVKHFISRVNISGGAGISNDNFIAGYGNTTSAVDAVIFQMSSGNIDSGVIKMYGLSKS